MLLETLLPKLPKSARSLVAEYARQQEEVQRKQTAAFEENTARLTLENKLLREEWRLLRIEKFGASSEKLNDEQLALLETEPVVTQSEMKFSRRPARPQRREHPGREVLPAHLERREFLIPCPPQQCRCGKCGSFKELIGYETTEVLDKEPGTYFVRVTKREKRACTTCEDQGVVTAPVEPRAFLKAKASDGVIVDVLVKKFVEHQPVYRQCETLDREAGIDISRQTMCGWIMAAGVLLEPVREAMRAELLAGGYIQADETPIDVQDPDTIGKNHQAY
jgi:transposase